MDFNCVINFLFKWQTLIGGILGGLFALGAAMVVAKRSEKQNNMSAAIALNRMLLSYLAINDNFEDDFEKNNKTEDLNIHKATAFTERLFDLRPQKTSLFEMYVDRLSTINDLLAAHVQSCYECLSTIEFKMNRLEKDYSEIQSSKTSSRSTNFSRNDAIVVERNFKYFIQYAKCTIFLLDYFILKRPIFIKRFWFYYFPSKILQECQEIINKGPARS